MAPSRKQPCGPSQIVECGLDRYRGTSYLINNLLRTTRTAKHVNQCEVDLRRLFVSRHWVNLAIVIREIRGADVRAYDPNRWEDEPLSIGISRVNPFAIGDPSISVGAILICHPYLVRSAR